MIVLSVAPLNFIAIAPPAHRLCDDTRCSVYPFANRQSKVAPQRTAIVMSLSEIFEFQAPKWHTVLNGVVGDMSCRFATHRANAATGQILPPMASWWMTAPFVPFFVCAMEMVALSACKRTLRLELWSSRTPQRHSWTSNFLRGTVCFVPRACAGFVYSPTWKR